MKKYNKESFVGCNEIEFEEFVCQSETSLGQLENIVKSELEAYNHNSGLYRTVAWSVRKKEPRRICEKLNRIRRADDALSYDRLDGLLELHGCDEFYLRDIVHDLVGARVVVYFSEQLKFTLRYVLTWPVFDVTRIIVYEDEGRRWMTASIKTMLQGISEKRGHRLVIKKQANNPSYESIHIHFKINSSFSNRLKQHLGLDVVDVNELSRFTVEIQIRTILQHAWAQNEHNLSYSVKKREIDSSFFPDSKRKDLTQNDYVEILKEDFAQLKANLSVAESMQNLIWDRYVRNHQAINSANDSIDFGDRLSVFGDENERLRVEDVQSELLKAVNDSSDMEVALEKLKSLAAELSEKYGGSKILSSEKPDDIYNWARQRAFLLVIAYAAIRSDSEAGAVINKFFRDNLYDLTSVNVLDNTARLYAYIRLWDNEKKHEIIDSGNAQDQLLLIDPVASYRQAFVEYSAENPKYALSLIEKSIEERKKLIEGGKKDRAAVLNLRHLYRRRAQCYWAMYLLFADGTDENLNLAEREYERSFEEIDDIFMASEKEEVENVKLAGLYGALLFHRYIYGGKWTWFDLECYVKKFNKYVLPNIYDMSRYVSDGFDLRGFVTHVVILDKWHRGESSQLDVEQMKNSFSPELDQEWVILSDIRNAVENYESLEQFEARNRR